MWFEKKIYQLSIQRKITIMILQIDFAKFLIPEQSPLQQVSTQFGDSPSGTRNIKPGTSVGRRRKNLNYYMHLTLSRMLYSVVLLDDLVPAYKLFQNINHISARSQQYDLFFIFLMHCILFFRLISKNTNLFISILLYLYIRNLNIWIVLFKKGKNRKSFKTALQQRLSADM